MNSNAYIWKCRNGHESAHSEIEIMSLSIPPMCGLIYDDGTVCLAPLETKLRPFSLTDQSELVIYDRSVLVEVIVYHARTNTSGCHCGWGVLGASYAEHVADVYEDSIRARYE